MKRYTKAIIIEGGKIKTFSSVRLPALLPAHNNSNVLLMRVGVFGRRYIGLPKSKVFTFPLGELEKPQIVIGIADMIAEQQTERLDQEIDYNKELESQNTKLKNQVDELYTLLKKLRTESNEQKAVEIEGILAKFVEMQKALRPVAKKGGKF